MERPVPTLLSPRKWQKPQQHVLPHSHECRVSLTCTGAPVVGLAHPFVALTKGPEVHTWLSHVTDADPTVAPAPAVAQRAPGGLPRGPAPALRLGLGEPARGARAASAWGDKPRRGRGQAQTLSRLLCAHLPAPCPLRWRQIISQGTNLPPEGLLSQTNRTTQG